MIIVINSLYNCMKESHYHQWMYIHACTYADMYIEGVYIKTHGSESRGQEEAGLRDEPVSYLQVAPL